jgi:hypothetical protein
LLGAGYTLFTSKAQGFPAIMPVYRPACSVNIHVHHPSIFLPKVPENVLSSVLALSTQRNMVVIANIPYIFARINKPAAYKFHLQYAPPKIYHNYKAD